MTARAHLRLVADSGTRLPVATKPAKPRAKRIPWRDLDPTVAMLATIAVIVLIEGAGLIAVLASR